MADAIDFRRRIVGPLQPKSIVGEPVNIHVVESRKEPEPDFEAMQRLIESSLDLM